MSFLTRRRALYYMTTLLVFGVFDVAFWFDRPLWREWTDGSVVAIAGVPLLLRWLYTVWYGRGVWAFWPPFSVKRYPASSTANTERFESAKRALPADMHAEELSVTFRSNFPELYWAGRHRLVLDESFASSLNESEIAFLLSFALVGQKEANRPYFKGFAIVVVPCALVMLLAVPASGYRWVVPWASLLFFGSLTLAFWAAVNDMMRAIVEGTAHVSSRSAGISLLEKYRVAVAGPVERWFAERMLGMVRRFADRREIRSAGSAGENVGAG